MDCGKNFLGPKAWCLFQVNQHAVQCEKKRKASSEAIVTAVEEVDVLKLQEDHLKSLKTLHIGEKAFKMSGIVQNRELGWKCPECTKVFICKAGMGVLTRLIWDLFELFNDSNE